MKESFDRKEVDAEVAQGREAVLWQDVSDFDDQKQLIATQFRPKLCPNCGGKVDDRRDESDRRRHQP
jgi:hypothetical protein